MDVRWWSVIISATVAIIIAVGNHFLVEPYKEKRRWKKQQLSNLYAPLYALMSAKMNLIKDQIISKNKLMIGSVEPSPLLSRDYMNEFIMKNAGYGSMEFLEMWGKYISSLKPDDETTSNLVKSILCDYNNLKKELGQEFNQVEIDTGIPEIVKELRNK
ncbi:hypothetical protein [Bacillus sp. FSL K6-6540]|uniref:hypothetical protein n=1 Tax=Bacillus sp. FSL K6-6540 TaxID=2921512 RepID=UPI0030FA949C